MKKTDFGSVRMLLALENQSVRQALTNALQYEGWQRPVEVFSHDKLLSILVEHPFDVIVTATELTGEFISPFLGQLRQGNLIHHPLPVIIQLLTSADGEYVRKVIDSGPDDLLQLPISAGQLLGRLAVLSEKRKPFVVTSDYIGPDRRQANRPGTMVIPQIEVPNPLQMRMMRLPEETYQFELDACARKLKQMRLERFAFELQWLLRAIRALYQAEQKDDEKLQTFCERIKTVLIYTPAQLAPQDWKQIQPLADRLTMGANIVLKNGFSADATVLQGLAGLVKAVTGAMLDRVPAEVLEAAGWPLSAGAK